MHKGKRKTGRLQILESLDNRMELTEEHQKNFFLQRKGHEGEADFFILLRRVFSIKSSVLGDLWLKIGAVRTQIDCLIFTGNELFIYEVKNYSGSYYYEEGNFYSHLSDQELFNPFNQLDKNRILLQKLLMQLYPGIQIKAFVVFIHPTFSFYQAPRNQPFLLRNQLEEHFHKIYRNLNCTMQEQPDHIKLILKQQYQEEVRYEELPAYDYSTLKKGITCRKCQSFLLTYLRQKCQCNQCVFMETIDAAIARTTTEFMLLFPEIPVTKKVIYDWCDCIHSPQRVQRILHKHFILQKRGRSSFYLNK